MLLIPRGVAAGWSQRAFSLAVLCKTSLLDNLTNTLARQGRFEWKKALTPPVPVQSQDIALLAYWG